MFVHNQPQTKAAVTVAEMARMVGLSRARFYQLIGSAFPDPVYDVSTRRPFYAEEAQKVCLEVRRRNCGIDGKPILFYCRRGGAPTLSNKSSKAKTKAASSPKYTAIVDAVKALGLVTVTSEQVAKSVTQLFPSGINSVAEAEVIRAVFVHIQSFNSSDNLGR
jgi:hypothetical protein